MTAMIRCCLVVDDHPIVRRGVSDLLLEMGLCTEIEEVGTGAAAIQAARARAWDLVILDVGLPDRPGIEVLIELKRLQPQAVILILSLYPEPGFGLQVMQAGAAGYVTKDRAAADLVRAVKRVLSGRLFFSADLMRYRARTPIGTSGTMTLPVLSDREQELLRRFAKREGVSKIARSLKLSVKTVNTCRTRLLAKCSCRTMTELTRYAAKAGLLS